MPREGGSRSEPAPRSHRRTARSGGRAREAASRGLFRGSFPAEPREAELPGSALLPARGECFLAATALLDRGSSSPGRARHHGLTGLMVRRLRLPSTTDAPFARWLLWSSCHPRSGRRWGRPPHRRVARPFALLIGPVC